MSTQRRLKALALVDRLKSHQLETIGASMSALRARQAEIVAQQQALETQAQQEATNTTPENNAFLQTYLVSVAQHQAQLATQMEVLEEQIALLEDELLEAFRDVKTNEAVSDSTAKQLQQDQAHKEMIVLEDANNALSLLKLNAPI